jgi:hypothetical protein
MLDLRVFRHRTYGGANITSLAFAACFLTLLTFLPLYFQGGLRASPIRAGLLMLPMAIPLFALPRLVSGHLMYRLSGRALLTMGLSLVSVGLFEMALAAPSFRYDTMLVGMLVAGILNGEMAKVSMTVIPPERAGMASGIGGTIRFSGIVIGFAALGAVLYQRIAGVIGASLEPGHSATAIALARAVASGKLTAGSEATLAAQAFGAGYQTMLLAAACVTTLATAISWLCVRADQTRPLARGRASQPSTMSVD